MTHIIKNYDCTYKLLQLLAVDYQRIRFSSQAIQSALEFPNILLTLSNSLQKRR